MIPIDETGPWVDYRIKEIMPREILIALARSFGLMGEDRGTRCTASKRKECRDRYGKYFEDTCTLCPDRKQEMSPTR
jgi:hypothetical protein